MKKPPKFPVYDPATDGNRFEWIIKQADVLHEQLAKERLNRPKYDYLTGRPVSPSAPR
ncbi:hypothetical protein Dsui_0217 [Azospira oryzae PS]|uniref:Uncharacterized protein n=1 Tax=Azospira oryzae (strain ATCC BAA-33 / DSM 13638 / PS) TaxID=640081 RepID=G8QMQ7_AZOOP|nr:hypothetical protein [Azospira oryzae]AEV24637.1 hypothetical protein Dsui_0217 [Azospira oryzae PS]